MTTSLLFCIASIVHAHNTTHTYTHNSQTGDNGGWAVIIAFALFFIVAAWSTFVRIVGTCCEEFKKYTYSLPLKYIKSTCCTRIEVDTEIEVVSV